MTTVSHNLPPYRIEANIVRLTLEHVLKCAAPGASTEEAIGSLLGMLFLFTIRLESSLLVETVRVVIAPFCKIGERFATQLCEQTQSFSVSQVAKQLALLEAMAHMTVWAKVFIQQFSKLADLKD